MNQQKPIVAQNEIDRIALGIATGNINNIPTVRCCGFDQGPPRAIYRRKVFGETLSIIVRDEQLQLALAEDSARRVMDAADQYTALRNRSEWLRGTDYEDIECARDYLRDAQNDAQRRLDAVGIALSPLLSELYCLPRQCGRNLCRWYRLK